jgi:hypothetical protein
MLKKRHDILLILFGAIMFCSFAFVNHFPLVYPDTGTYVWSGFAGFVPFDRPIFYGLFIRHVSLWASLWLVIFVQGLLISFLILKSLEIFYSGNKRNYIFCFSILFLTAFTGLPYNTSVLLADIFSPIGMLCLLNLLLNKQLSKSQLVFISILFVISTAMHNANFLIFFIVFILLAAYAAFKKLKKQPVYIKRTRIITCSILFLSFLVLVPIVNYSYTKKAFYARGGHLFLMNHIVQTGILLDYLNENCAKKKYRICQYKDSLIAPDVNFVWNPNRSALYKTWGWQCFTDSKPEFDSIIFDMVTTPKYFVKLAQKSIEYTFKQYFAFEIPGSSPSLKDSPPYSVVHDYFHTDEREYLNSIQNLYGMYTPGTSAIQFVLVLFSIALFICILSTPMLFNMLEQPLKWFLVLILIFSLVNAAVCSNFSEVADRFQDRIVWLLPFVAIIVCEHLISDYLSKRKAAGNIPA